MSLGTIGINDKTGVMLYDKLNGVLVDYAGKPVEDVNKSLKSKDVDYLGQYKKNDAVYYLFGVKETDNNMYKNIEILGYSKNDIHELLDLTKAAFKSENDISNLTPKVNVKDDVIHYSIPTFSNGKIFVWCKVESKGNKPRYSLLFLDDGKVSTTVGYTDYSDKVVIHDSKGNGNETIKKEIGTSKIDDPLVGVDVNNDILFVINSRVYSLEPI